jgi:hypothetical protein
MKRTSDDPYEYSTADMELHDGVVTIFWNEAELHRKWSKVAFGEFAAGSRF